MIRPPMRADEKAVYALRAEDVARAFLIGNDLQRLVAWWRVLRHHGWAAARLVAGLELRHALEIGPGLDWPCPPAHHIDDERT